MHIQQNVDWIFAKKLIPQNIFFISLAVTWLSYGQKSQQFDFSLSIFISQISLIILEKNLYFSGYVSMCSKSEVMLKLASSGIVLVGSC